MLLTTGLLGPPDASGRIGLLWTGTHFEMLVLGEGAWSEAQPEFGSGLTDLGNQRSGPTEIGPKLATMALPEAFGADTVGHCLHLSWQRQLG